MFLDFDLMETVKSGKHFENGQSFMHLFLVLLSL